MDRIERTVRRLRALPGLRQLDRRRYRKIFARHTQANLFSGVYATFAEARRDFPPTKPAGYDHQGAAKMYGGPAQAVRLVDYPVIFWLSTLIGDHDGLFDYGGHIGLRYYAYSRYLRLPPGFTWTVWDVPAVTAEGRRLAAENHAEGLVFSDDLATAAAAAEIFFASGSLQYFEEPFPDTLVRLGIRPRHILINGFPLHEKHEFVTINNMTTAYCTYKVFHKRTFLERMAADGYLLRDIWQNSPDKRCHIPFHPEYDGAVYTGMLLSDGRR